MYRIYVKGAANALVNHQIEKANPLLTLISLGKMLNALQISELCVLIAHPGDAFASRWIPVEP
jgi:hypothetical protein